MALWIVSLCSPAIVANPNSLWVCHLEQPPSGDTSSFDPFSYKKYLLVQLSLQSTTLNMQMQQCHRSVALNL